MTATYRSRGSPAASADRFLPAIATPLIRADGLMAWATAVRFLSFGRNELVATLADEDAKDPPPKRAPLRNAPKPGAPGGPKTGPDQPQRGRTGPAKPDTGSAGEREGGGLTERRGPNQPPDADLGW